MFAPIVFLSTTTQPLTSTAATWQPDADTADVNAQDPKTAWKIRLFGDVDFHVAVNTGDATVNDVRVAGEYHGIIVVVPPGGTLSVIKATGANDGTLWATRVKSAA